MIALIAGAALLQSQPVAVVLAIPRRPDVPGWDIAAHRAEAAAEGMLRARGFTIADPKPCPSFTPDGDPIRLLTAALGKLGAQVVVGISIVGVGQREWPRSPVVPISPKWPPDRHAPLDAKKALESLPKNEGSVTLRVWLLEAGAARPYIDGKSPSDCQTGLCDMDRLVGDATQKCMEDVLRRFLRERTRGATAP